ncbi:hypothetical protein M8998_07250 [Sphingobacterium sp. lm-10]|uniref:hypothetical protein n=1 Tax=Sphingobacterium sp. lm-10 TaxID=2944904 RepID=UPI002020D53F|nr:hypothetical protein [Sphingobacterium sp. lm-10]MCL7987730.1 hypothetical protein [Sphingobacterium sp. lm-10]
MKRELKSSVDGMEDVKLVLFSAGIADMLSGEIRLLQRKLNSAKEDCVINTLIWDADQVQGGILNVNFHVPNLTGQRGDNPTAVDNTQPNIPRLHELGKVAATALDGFEGFDFSLKLRDPGQVDNHGNQWIYNIQVEYTFLRTELQA